MNTKMGCGRYNNQNVTVPGTYFHTDLIHKICKNSFYCFVNLFRRKAPRVLVSESKFKSTVYCCCHYPPSRLHAWNTNEFPSPSL